MSFTDVFSDLEQMTAQSEAPAEPLYRMFSESRIPVSKALGKLWEARIGAAKTVYDDTYHIWNETFRYFRHTQLDTMDTPRGRFIRGDSTENVVAANIRTSIPATYSKNPDISLSTTDDEDVPFIQCLEKTLNVLFKKKNTPGMNLKAKSKKQVLHAELTNFGILKLDFVDKLDSSEAIIEQLETLTRKLDGAKSKGEIEEVMGQLLALEEALEVSEPRGFKLINILPHNLIIDPQAEASDGSDALWMGEEAFLPTDYLKARFSDGKNKSIFKPTHVVQFRPGQPDQDDPMILVMEDYLQEEKNRPVDFTNEERLAYQYRYMTKVIWLWDKVTRRVMLFLEHDWTWPLWVWDDPLGLSRFFPYFILSYSDPISGTIQPGEAASYLDQQDEINDVNRQFSRIRRSIFQNWIYNSEAIAKDEAQKLVSIIKSAVQGFQREPGVIGIKVPEGTDVSKVLHTIQPPSLDYPALFNKEPIYQSVDRVSSTSDALRGVQFKTNTTEDAVEAYMSATRLRIGVKVDAIEGVIEELALAVCEIAVQKLSMEDVAGLIGLTNAQSWKNMTVQQFNSQVTIEVAAGSIEKPTSVFKKKEAIEIAQAIGQFASMAPATTLKVVLKVLSNAFTEVIIKQEDWDAIDQELQQMSQAQPMGGAGGGQDVPQELKQRVVQAAQSGASKEQLAQMVQQGMNGGGGGSPMTPQRPN